MDLLLLLNSNLKILDPWPCKSRHWDEPRQNLWVKINIKGHLGESWTQNWRFIQTLFNQIDKHMKIAYKIQIILFCAYNVDPPLLRIGRILGLARWPNFTIPCQSSKPLIQDDSAGFGSLFCKLLIIKSYIILQKLWLISKKDTIHILTLSSDIQIDRKQLIYIYVTTYGLIISYNRRIDHWPIPTW